MIFLNHLVKENIFVFVIPATNEVIFLKNYLDFAGIINFQSTTRSLVFKSQWSRDQKLIHLVIRYCIINTSASFPRRAFDIVSFLKNAL